MKIHPNLADGTVHIILTAREAVGLAERLFKTAMQSGGAGRSSNRQDLTPEEQEQEL